MNTRSARYLLVFMGVLSIPVWSASAQVQGPEQRSCINLLNERGHILALAQLRTFGQCYENARHGSLGSGQTVATCADSDVDGRIADASWQVDDAGTCDVPLPSFGTVPSERAIAIVLRKMVELEEDLFGTGYDNGVHQLTSEEQGCQRVLVRALKRMMKSRLAAASDCITFGLAGATITSGTGLADCVETKLLTPDSSAANAKMKLDRQIKGRCGSVDLDVIYPGRSCVGQSASSYADCVDDRVDCHVCQMLAKTGSVSESIDCDTADNGSIDASCPMVPDECPTSLSIISESRGIDGAPTRISIGYRGRNHNLDIAGGFPLHVALTCQVETWPCGECTIDGMVGKQGRCINDAAVACDEIGPEDIDDCGAGPGNECGVHFMAPRIARYSDQYIEERLTSPLSGSFHNETGELALHAEVRSSFGHYSMPFCVGDDVMNDGIRGGLCTAGWRIGLPCDASGDYYQFGRTSIECPRSEIQGYGATKRDFTTGHIELPSQIPCTAPSGALCPCGICDGSRVNYIGCSSNADCGVAGPCVAADAVLNRTQLPNACQANQTCYDTGEVGDSIGECVGPPLDTTYPGCDGFLDDEGHHLTDCGSECVGSRYPGGDGGVCREQNLPCLLDPVVATGSPNAVAPVLAAISCAGPTPAGVPNGDGATGVERIVMGVRLVRN